MTDEKVLYCLYRYNVERYNSANHRLNAMFTHQEGGDERQVWLHLFSHEDSKFLANQHFRKLGKNYWRVSEITDRINAEQDK
jgi:hypothetical protein